MAAKPDVTRLRELASRLDCFTDDDVRLLTGWSQSTRAAYRRRRKGPPFVRLGTVVLYPCEKFREWMDEQVREPRAVAPKSLL